MLYFAYGSNLNKSQMSRRCPDSIPIGPVILPNARLVYRYFADVEFCEGHEVHGGVWKIGKGCERELDRYEGVRSGHYKKSYLKLALNRAGVIVHEDCLIYVMVRQNRYEAPDDSYVACIHEGYGDFGLDLANLSESLRMFPKRKYYAPEDFAYLQKRR